MSDEANMKPSHGPVTAMDVAEAVDIIAGGDASATNASAVRRHIGRGSNATIQKHLHAMRSAGRNTANNHGLGDTPPMPMDEMQAVWRAAIASALTASYAQLLKLQQERDDAHAHVEIIESDLSSAQNEIDRLLESTRNAEERASAAISEAKRLEESFKADLAQKDILIVDQDQYIREIEGEQALERFRSQAEQATLERVISQHAADLARSLESQKSAAADFATQIAAMASEIANLRSKIDQP